MLIQKPRAYVIPFICLLGMMAAPFHLRAQQDVFAPPPPPSQASTIQPAGTRTIPDPPLDSLPPPETPFEWGAVSLKPHFLYRFLYGDGIQATPGHSSTTAINSFAPGLLTDLGEHWMVDYTPTWELFSNRVFHDTLDEYANLLGAYNFGTWSFQLNQNYTYTSEPLIETGRQTTQEMFGTSVDITDQITRAVLAETIGSQNLRDGIDIPDTKEWSVLEWIHYRFSEELDVAVGGDAGYVAVGHGINTLYYGPQVQVIANPTQKISVSASVGLDHREFLSEPRSTLDTPTFSGSAQYAPFESTTLGITASRQVAESFFVNQSTKTTQWRAVLKQRLLEHYLLSASVGQFDSDYISNQTGDSSGRSDSNLSYNIRLNWKFLRRGSMGVFYQWGRNSSNVKGFGFETHQVGFELGYRY
jgi:hypothetical protein